MKRALWITLGISIFGAIFSGVLSYRESFAATSASCPSPGPTGTVFGYPACVYGFFMYLTIAGTAGAGLIAGRRSQASATLNGQLRARNEVRAMNGSAP